MNEFDNPVVRTDMFGRLDIYATVDDINADNVLGELNSAMPFHIKNMLQEEFLYWYRRGVMPILNRKKDIREYILNKVPVNVAASIVDFKNGFFLTQPATYMSRRKGVQTKLKKLNEFLYRSGKQEADNKIADWFHTVGKGVLYVEPSDEEVVPFKAYALDPRSAFVIYSLKPGNRPVMGVNFVVRDGQAMFDVFTESQVFHLSGSAAGRMMTTEKNQSYMATAVELLSVEPNVLGKIPIIEYRYNSVNMGAYEPAISLIDELCNIYSNCCDGIEQFIQSLAVAVNCEFPENTTLSDIRKAGFISFRSVGENKASFTVLSEQLDQTQTKVLIDSIYEEILRICAMPARNNGKGGTYDTTGAAILASFGWYQAESSRRNSVDLFKESNRQFDDIITGILKRKNLQEIETTDFELNMESNETANVQSKAQAFQTLLASGMHPELAAAKSGISNDPVKDMQMSAPYMKMIFGDPEAAVKAEEKGNGQGEAIIVEEDNNNGENETGGSV